MTLQELLDSYAKITACELPLDSNDMCRCDSVMPSKSISNPPNGPIMSSLYSLGTACTNPGERLLPQLLESNFFGCETGAASLGCDPETSEVLLCV